MEYLSSRPTRQCVGPELQSSQCFGQYWITAQPVCRKSTPKISTDLLSELKGQNKMCSHLVGIKEVMLTVIIQISLVLAITATTQHSHLRISSVFIRINTLISPQVLPFILKILRSMRLRRRVMGIFTIGARVCMCVYILLNFASENFKYMQKNRE